ncbi:MAG: methyltransferase domain-containing protein [Nitrospirota bacterium]|nr:methyltransferase domain-containing protein [Nitrospirota bacterium]
MSFIEFYREHNISPVHQDISDLERHFQRRQHLYRHLGILPSIFEGKEILEVGPGSGYNSIYIASLKPSVYHLVEGNQTGVREMESLFDSFPDHNKNVTVFPMLIEEFAVKHHYLYDVVLCEGMLPGLPEPEKTLELLARFVKPGGVLVITCIDPCSQFFESLRHLIGQLLIVDCETIENMVDRLLPVFSSHLDTLKDMSRSKEDWIIDNIINPAAIGPALSMADAIESIGEKFEVYGTSPRIFSDWRWYKTIHNEKSSFNTAVLNQYWTMVHNFLDHERKFEPRAEADNHELYRLCSLIREQIRKFREDHDTLLIKQIIVLLEEISANIKAFSMELTFAIEEVINILNEHSGIPEYIANSEHFKRIFGRGQQYMSFTRTA